MVHTYIHIYAFSYSDQDCHGNFVIKLIDERKAKKEALEHFRYKIEIWSNREHSVFIKLHWERGCYLSSLSNF